MSLVQHVSQLEGQDREEALVDLFLPPLERAESIARSDRERRLSLGSGFDGSKAVRRLASYDYLKPPEDTIEEYGGGVTQYTVSTTKRVAQVIVTVLACWFASGIVFGFAALKPILIQEGVYQDLCTPEELEKGVEVCFEQDLRLNFFFSLASTTANLSALPVGGMLDRYGPKVCFLLGSACLAVGSIFMSLAFQIDDFDGYTIGNFFLALGGNFIFLPSFQIANAFPKYAGTIVALVTGAFDASAAVFLIARLIYDVTDRTFKPQHFFLAYLAVPLAILICQLTFLPSESYKTPGQLQMKIEHAEDPMRDVHDSDDELPDDEVWRRRKIRSTRRKNRQKKLDKLVGSPDRRRRREKWEEHRQDAAGVWGALHNKPAKEQMLTPWFYLLTLLTVLQMIRMNYFIATVREQYFYMLGSIELASRINDFFDWALPIGGVISTPFLGILLDNVSVPGVLLLILVIITVIGIVGSIAALWAGYVNVILFVALRPLYYSAMSDYATKVFGFATFGRVYGTIICFSGVINLSQTGIVALTKTVFHGNPVPVNIFLAVAAFIVGVALVTYVTVQTRRMQTKLQDEDALTVTNTEADSIMESLLEEDEPQQGYGTINQPRQSWEP
ncbi:MFS transporter-like protein Fmp42 [Bimuria novae-zelandiae CBS 107.79]|uniref:MFS transporter-like protein Fmp42 n=1 Tax=Bimuria novae-zelandiae CBS 107.79 TaxID=1447943 RepID=A0A6A5VSL7_9PLEO|nr:MFS transporter-like protein Fmp42 [Bimuria novae-zelandiae CBS 107.79]